ncbi:anthranilate synthase component I [Helicobacter fennelliae]|uniref:anthranilate synthase component I n=1 Tax=Helicobacter fennelliae TaxID=215 RepID=UPI000E025056|nr:anthranilate synthase component I [Helicobacter fennelliae]STQ84910.1 anthranilate synthase component I [Helicobacter fennelliae]
MYPTLETLRAMPNLSQYKRVPLSKEIYADFITPIEAMRILKTHSIACFLLESVEQKHWGRYSFLGYNPTLELTSSRGQTMLKDKNGTKVLDDDPKKIIREILECHKSPILEHLPPFSGGLVGYFAYDYIRYNEPKLDFTTTDKDFVDVDLMLFNNVIVFDHFKQKIILITGMMLDSATDVKSLESSYNDAHKELKSMHDLLKSTQKNHIAPFVLDSAIKHDFSQAQYMQMVEKAKHYIYEGDIFQVVLSNPMRAKASGSLFDVYRVLRSTNPSPYMFYFSSSKVEIAGASPETLLKLEDSKLYTYPLAGSRRRGNDEIEDIALERELLSDEKELAEHNMLVDLGRNDVGRVAKFGSVKVEKYQNIERYSHIMHISSTISGILQDDKDALSALDAILPAGTLSGAPKIRACEIINELEGRSRGIYGGAIGYLDFAGNMDMCISIRLIYKKNDEICIQSGAGIVYDSDPKSEFDECAKKAQAIIEALKIAQNGIDDFNAFDDSSTPKSNRGQR